MDKFSLPSTSKLLKLGAETLKKNEKKSDSPSPYSKLTSKFNETSYGAIIPPFKSNQSKNEDSFDKAELEERVSTDFSNLSKSQINILISLSLQGIASFMTMSLMSPFFPKEAELKGVTQTWIGIIFGAYALTMFLISPFIGSLVSLWGPKTTLVLGLLISAISSALFGCFVFIEDKNFFIAVCFMGRVIEGFGSGASEIASSAIIFKAYPGKVGTIFGIFEVSTGVGLCLGPLVGGIFYEIGGFALPFWTISMVLILVAVLNAFLLDPDEAEDEDEEDDADSSSGKFYKSSRTLISLLSNFSILALLFSVLVVSIAWSYLDPILEPYLRNRFGFTPSRVGYEFFLLLSFCYGVSSPICGALSDRIKNIWLFMSIGLFGLAVGCFLLAPAPITIITIPDTEAMKLISLIFIGVSSGFIISPSFNSLLLLAVSAGHKDGTKTYGMISGLWISIYSLGETMGPVTGAALYEAFNFQIALISLGILTLLTGSLFLLYFTSFGPDLSKNNESRLSSRSGSSDLQSISSSHHCSIKNSSDEAEIKNIMQSGTSGESIVIAGEETNGRVTQILSSANHNSDTNDEVDDAKNLSDTSGRDPFDRNSYEKAITFNFNTKK